MTHTPPPPPAAHSAQTSPPDNTRWTGERASAFLKALARTGQVASAAQAVGMSRQSAYRLRARAPQFAQFWDIAMDQAAAVRASAGKRRRGQRKAVHPLLAKEPRSAPREAPAEARAAGDTSGPAA